MVELDIKTPLLESSEPRELVKAVQILEWNKIHPIFSQIVSDREAVEGWKIKRGI